MKVKIGDTIYDSEKEPIALIFESDNHRKSTANHLSNMEPNDGKRVYVQFPEETDIDIEQFIKEC